MRQGPVVEQAAAWAALLDSGAATADERAACETWCAAAPGHRQTLERMRGFDAQIAGAGPIAQRALGHLLRPASGRINRNGGALLSVAALVLAGWAGWRSDYVQDRFPDYRTAQGEISAVALADGSQLTIDTAGAVRAHLRSHRRTIRLIEGRLLAQVAPDRERPFVVETADGSATALGTVFTVAVDAQGTLVAVTRSHVRACAADALNCRDIGPGERVRIAHGTVVALPSLAPEAIAAWQSGWMEVDDQDLSAVLAELNRYLIAPVRFDPADLRGVRVTASLPLTDAPRALKGLAHTPGVALVVDADGAPRMIRRH